jgi:hypothetical protein
VTTTQKASAMLNNKRPGQRPFRLGRNCSNFS